MARKLRFGFAKGVAILHPQKEFPGTILHVKEKEGLKEKEEKKGTSHQHNRYNFFSRSTPFF